MHEEKYVVSFRFRFRKENLQRKVLGRNNFVKVNAVRPVKYVI